MTTEPYRCPHGRTLNYDCCLPCRIAMLVSNRKWNAAEANLAHSPTYRDAVSRASAPRQRVGALKSTHDSGNGVCGAGVFDAWPTMTGAQMTEDFASHGRRGGADHA